MYAVAQLKTGRLLTLTDEESYLRIRNILMTKKTDCIAVYKLKKSYDDNNSNAKEFPD